MCAVTHKVAEIDVANSSTRLACSGARRAHAMPSTHPKTSFAWSLRIGAPLEKQRTQRRLRRDPRPAPRLRPAHPWKVCRSEVCPNFLRGQMTPRCPFPPESPVVVQWHRTIWVLFGLRAGDNNFVLLESSN